MDVLSEAECAQWRARGFVAVPALFAPALVEQAVEEAAAAASVLGFPSREAPATNEIALSPRLAPRVITPGRSGGPKVGNFRENPCKFNKKWVGI